jgi:hypothetical protein
MPAQHNDKTIEKLKSTQEKYKEKISEFKEECHKRLDDRLKIYDARNATLDKGSSVTVSPVK